ncbi:protein MEMO1-like [Artemia franciscana]
MTSVRTASHAGSWYSSNARELNKELEEWLSKADLCHGPARAIIAPHAGYRYSGPCAAHAYRQISPAVIKRVFILGPSHRVRLSKCALTQMKRYATPLYDLVIDMEVNNELAATGHFQWMSADTDENEHSIELHLPYVAKVFERYRDQFTVIPILVGSLSTDKETLYGQILSKYLADPENLFVISSDFCHWGGRFSYKYYEPSAGPIFKQITQLDKQGMDLIELLDAEGFSEYLRETGNTICGRHPISVLLNAVKALKKSSQNGFHPLMKFLKYAQSSQCTSPSDSSVSYASAALLMD